MTRAGRLFALALGGALILLGLWLWRVGGQGWGAALFGIVVIAGTVLDGSYRARRLDRHDDGARWQRTGERELDHATGEIVEVWYDPLTGRRRYEAISDD